MIEAVNSVLANSSLLRGNAEQGGQPRANIAVNSEPKVEAPVAPYVSPYIQVDNNYNKAVLQIRDSNTGDVVRQFPSETTLRARAAQAELERLTSQRQETSAPQPQQNSAPQSSPSRAGFIAIQQQAVQSSQALQQDVSTASNVRVAEAQIASAALSAGALSGTAQSSVSVTA